MEKVTVFVSNDAAVLLLSFPTQTLLLKKYLIQNHKHHSYGFRWR